MDSEKLSIVFAHCDQEILFSRCSLFFALFDSLAAAPLFRNIGDANLAQPGSPKTVCIFASAFTSPQQKNLTRQHLRIAMATTTARRMCRPAQPTESFRNFLFCFRMRAGWNLSVCAVIVCRLRGRTLDTLLHRYQPCHRVALKLWFLLLPSAFYSLSPLSFQIFFEALELVKCGVDNSVAPHFFFLDFFFTRLRGYSTSRDDTVPLHNI